MVSAEGACAAYYKYGEPIEDERQGEQVTYGQIRKM
jgi:hypothetical protein